MGWRRGAGGQKGMVSALVLIGRGLGFVLFRSFFSSITAHRKQERAEEQREVSFVQIVKQQQRECPRQSAHFDE